MIPFNQVPMRHLFYLPEDLNDAWRRVSETRAHRRANLQGAAFESETPVVLHPIPSLYALQGLPGSGKSHEAKLLARKLNAVIIASDDIRAKLALVMPDPFEPEANNWPGSTWGLLHRLVREFTALILAQRKTVIYDATNIHPMALDMLEQLAWHEGARLIWWPVPIPGKEEWYRRLAERPEGLEYWLAVVEKMKSYIPEEMYVQLGL